jgi:hypothetical protein
LEFLKERFPEMPGSVAAQKVDWLLDLAASGEGKKKIRQQVERLRAAAVVDEVDMAAEYAWVHTNASFEWEKIENPPSKRAVTTLEWTKSGGGMTDFMRSHLKSVEKILSQGQKADSFRDDLRDHGELCDRLIRAASADPEGFALVSPAGARKTLGQRAEGELSGKIEHPCPDCGVETAVENRILNDEEVQGRFCPQCTSFWLGGPDGSQLKAAGAAKVEM